MNFFSRSGLSAALLGACVCAVLAATAVVGAVLTVYEPTPPAVPANCVRMVVPASTFVPEMV